MRFLTLCHRWARRSQSIDTVAIRMATTSTSHVRCIQTRLSSTALQHPNTLNAASTSSIYDPASAPFIPSMISPPVTPRLYSSHPKQKVKHHRPKYKNIYLNVKDYNTPQDLLDAALANLDQLADPAIAAVWSKLPRVLYQYSSYSDTSLQLPQCEFQVFSLLEYTMNSLGRLKPKELTTITLGMAKIAKKLRGRDITKLGTYELAFRNLMLQVDVADNDGTFRLLAEEASCIIPTYNPRELSNLSYAYALLGYNPILDDGDSLFEKIAMNAIHNLEEFNPQDLSNMIWSFATLRVSQSHLFQAAGKVMATSHVLNEFKPQEISNIVYAFAAADQSHIEMFQRVGDYIASLDDLDAYTPSQLSNIVWAYAKLNVTHSALFGKVGKTIEGIEDMNTFAPQTYSNIVWSYATADEECLSLFEKIGNAIDALDNLDSFQPQALSNTVWAYATAGIHHIGLFDKIGKEIVNRESLKSFKLQELSNTVWAYATANIQHPELFQKVKQDLHARDDLHASAALNLSNILWAYAKAGEANSALFDKMGNAIVESDIRHYSFQNISNILWSHGKANMPNPVLFEKVGDVIVGETDLSNATPQALVNIAMAYAKVNEPRSDLFEQIGESIFDCHNLNSFTPQALANLAWAFAVADVDMPMLFNDDFTEALVENEEQLNHTAKRQLYQWHLWQAEENINAGLPHILREQCRNAFMKNKHLTISELQEDVVNELYALGLHPIDEFLTESGYRLDALVEIEGKKIGIEVDGPSHFIGNKVNGSTILKNRQVKNVDGIDVVSIPYFVWNGFETDQSRKRNYLQTLFGTREKC